MFLEERLSCPNVNSSYGDAFAVQVTETLLNRYATLRHPYVKSRFVLLFGNQTMEEQLQKTISIFHRIGGMAGGFRFRNPSDFSSNNYIDTPTNQDQPLEQVGPNTFYLTRWYDDATPTTPRRRVKKPEWSTVLMSVYDGATYTPTTDFTYSVETGLVTFNGSLSSFETLYAGFLYDLPVMFETDLNDIEWQGAEIMSTTINLIEVMNPEDL